MTSRYTLSVIRVFAAPRLPREIWKHIYSYLRPGKLTPKQLDGEEDEPLAAHLTAVKYFFIEARNSSYLSDIVEKNYKSVPECSCRICRIARWNFYLDE